MIEIFMHELMRRWCSVLDTGAVRCKLLLYFIVKLQFYPQLFFHKIIYLVSIMGVENLES